MVRSTTSTISPPLVHHKYVKRELVNGKYRYYYSESENTEAADKLAIAAKLYKIKKQKEAKKREKLQKLKSLQTAQNIKNLQKLKAIQDANKRKAAKKRAGVLKLLDKILNNMSK